MVLCWQSSFSAGARTVLCLIFVSKKATRATVRKKDHAKAIIRQAENLQPYYAYAFAELPCTSTALEENAFEEHDT
jgi:hypothetical protein